MQDRDGPFRLRARREKALTLYRRGTVKIIIVSGAVGREGWDESAVMAAWLVERGVPADRVVADGEGRNTLLTARSARRILDGRGMSSAIAVSRYFHVPRTRLALRRSGIAAVGGAHADFFEWRDLYSIPREVVAYAAYLLRPGD